MWVLLAGQMTPLTPVGETILDWTATDIIALLELTHLLHSEQSEASLPAIAHQKV